MKTPNRKPLLITAAAIALFSLIGLFCLCLGSVTEVLAYLGTLSMGMIGLVGFSKDTWEDADHFFGDRVYHATKGSNVGHGYTITDTSAVGAPTYAPVDGSPHGELAVDFDTDVEVENVCVSQGDKLQYDIDKITEVGFRVKMNQAALDSATQFAFGLTGDRNDAIDTIAQAALFRIIGADDTTAVVCESDDGTTNLDDKATGQTLDNTYKWFVISFAAGKNDVRFFIDGQPVATSTKFDMSAYSGSLQFFAQIQKTADANVDGFTIDARYVRGRV